MKEEMKNFYKILFILFLFVFIFKLFSFLKYRTEKSLEIERERNYNLADIEKIKAESQIKIANIENDKLILKVCLDYKELTDFVSCVKTLKK